MKQSTVEDNEILREKILLFHSGSIGDTIIALPFIQAIRKKWPAAKLTLFTFSAYTGVKCVKEIIEPTGLIDEIIGFSTSGNKFEIAVKLLFSFIDIRRSRYDTAINIDRTVPDFYRERMLIWKLLCRIAGIKKVMGGDHLYILPGKKTGISLPEVPHHIELTAQRFVLDDLVSPPIKIDPCLTEEELKKAAAIWEQLAVSHCKIPIAVGVGGKKLRWPLERFAETIKQLRLDFPLEPLFFGGPENIQEIAGLVDKCGGINMAALNLSLRETIAVLQYCAFYLGNDTGTLHMAVAAGLKCVGIYSEHNYPGIWHPWGTGHIVCRKHFSCNGCFNKHCKDISCVNEITVLEVINAVRKMLKNVDIRKNE